LYFNAKESWWASLIASSIAWAAKFYQGERF